MTALIIVLLVLAVVGLTPVGGTVLFDENGFFAWIKLGVLRIKVYPVKKTKKKKKQTQPQKEKPAEETAGTGGGLDQIKEYLPIVKDALRHVKSGLVVNRLTVYYSAASPDAAETAIQYGAGWAVVGMIDGLLDDCKNVKNRDLQVFVRFDENAMPKIYVKATITIREWRLVKMVVMLGLKALQINNKQKKAVNTNGTSDK